MGRIRTIKPEAFKHAELFDAEIGTRTAARPAGLPLRWAFAGLWTVADREGRFRWRPRELKADVLPFDECDFSEVLAALEAAGFIRRYACQGKDFGYIPGFPLHQRPNHREAPSSLPKPPPFPGTHGHAPVFPGGMEWEGKGSKTL